MNKLFMIKKCFEVNNIYKESKNFTNNNKIIYIAVFTLKYIYLFIVWFYTLVLFVMQKKLLVDDINVFNMHIYTAEI